MSKLYECVKELTETYGDLPCKVECGRAYINSRLSRIPISYAGRAVTSIDVVTDTDDVAKCVFIYLKEES